MNRMNFAVLFFLGTSAYCAADLKKYESKYYVLHSDLPAERAKYIGRLMDATGKEYHRRFQGFRGKVRRKPVLKVFKDRAGYQAALALFAEPGFVANTAGMYVHADETVYGFDGPRFDETLKHECFHQFAAAVVGGELPPWTNEGLAEYFSEGEFDEKSGVLKLGKTPRWRVQRLQEAKANGTLPPIESLLQLRGEDWNDNVANREGSLQYSHAWALCHFLVHADGGKYTPVFDDFLKKVDGGLDADTAFKRAFGADIKPLQTKFDEYVAKLNP